MTAEVARFLETIFDSFEDTSLYASTIASTHQFATFQIPTDRQLARTEKAANWETSLRARCADGSRGRTSVARAAGKSNRSGHEKNFMPIWAISST